MKGCYLLRIIVVSYFLCYSVQASYTTAKQQVFVYTWDTYAATDLFKKFTQETGIEVITEIYSNNDTLLTKLKSGAAYDVIAPSGTFIELLVQEKLLRPLPPELRALAAGMTSLVDKPAYDPEHRYSLPLFFGTTGISVNSKLFSGTIVSWNDLFTRPPDEAPNIGMVDEIGSIMNVLAILLAKPFCADQREIYKAMYAVLAQQKPFVKVYGSTGYSERMVANEVALQLSFSSDAYKSRLANPNLVFIHPKEGVEAWIDTLAITALGKNFDNAVKFIAFVLRPENAKEYALFAGNLSTITAANALLPAEMRAAPELNIPAGVPAKIAVACPTEVVRFYNKIWERLMR